MSEEIENATYVYHKTEEAKIVSEEEALELYKQGWFDSPKAAEDSEVENQPGEDGTVLYKRIKVELVEGQPPAGDEFIIESDLFPEDLLEEAFKDGWYRTEAEAGNAPPDKPEGK